MTQQQTMQIEGEMAANRDTDRRGKVDPEDRDFMLANLLLNGNEQRVGFGRRKEDLEQWTH